MLSAEKPEVARHVENNSFRGICGGVCGEGISQAIKSKHFFFVISGFNYAIRENQYAVADFDPAPQLDAFWADALRPFRAVPRKDFGFRLVLRVVEDAAR